MVVLLVVVQCNNRVCVYVCVFSMHGRDALVLPELQQLQKTIEASGIEVNVHTTLTYADVCARWKQHHALVLQKHELLRQELEYKRLRKLLT